MKLNIKCPGCEVELTTQNAGGYQCYCEDCVAALPEWPKQKEGENKGYYLTGTRKSFRWVEARD